MDAKPAITTEHLLGGEQQQRFCEPSTVLCFTCSLVSQPIARPGSAIGG